MKSRKSFLLRINPSLYDELEAWAQQELRSVNGQIEYLLKEAVTKRRRLAGSDDAAKKTLPLQDEPD
ncbi:MAG: Arc family DNA-binding protein [Planctomycetes bacterium]|nr:Arc family DNA-binding protein [Planctomycetota bacterium]